MTLAEESWATAGAFEGLRETPAGSNHGPEIDTWVREGGGLDPGPPDHKGPPYCASFVSWCVLDATRRVGGPPQFVGGASVLKLRDRNPNLFLHTPSPGEVVVFLILHHDGTGHCGFAVADTEGNMTTREANTGPGPAVPAADREGDGYYERQDRRVSDCTGFLRIA